MHFECHFVGGELIVEVHFAQWVPVGGQRLERRDGQLLLMIAEARRVGCYKVSRRKHNMPLITFIRAMLPNV